MSQSSSASTTSSTRHPKDPGDPIARMPVLECWKAKHVIVSRRGQGTGYSGIKDPLFLKDNTRMFHGDAKASLDRLLRFMDSIPRTALKAA